MINFAMWLLALAGPMAVKVIVALGFTAMTFTGVQALVNSLITSAQGNWSAMPAAVLQVASLSGVPESLGMICGAYVARVGLWVTLNGTKFVLNR